MEDIQVSRGIKWSIRSQSGAKNMTEDNFPELKKKILQDKINQK
jgi:hypothetical protein